MARRILCDVSRIGKRTLDLVASTVRLQNRTNDTTYKLSPEGLERWKNYMFGNTSQGGGGKSPWTRLTGLFQTKKGGWIGRIEVKQFPAVIAVMKEAHAKGGTLTLLIQPDKSGKPAISMTAGDAYQKQDQGNQGNAGGGMFAQAAVAPPQQFSPAPVTTAPPAREVTFGKADVPKDSFDSLLESL